MTNYLKTNSNRFINILMSLIFCSLLCIFFFLIKTNIQQYTPFSVFDVSGYRVSIYLLSRCTLVILILQSTIATGYLIYKLFKIKNPDYFIIYDRIVIYFVLGSLANRLLGLIAFLDYKNLANFIPYIFLIANFMSIYIYLGKEKVFYEKIEKLNLFRFIIVLLAIPLFAIFLSRFWLFPIDGDFLSHYGQFFISASRLGSLAPNDVWYQFFFSKGNSFEILGSQIFDIAFIGDSSIGYVSIAIISLALLIRRFTNEIIIIILFFLLTIINLNYGDLGFLSKNHGIETAQILISIYLMSNFNYAKFVDINQLIFLNSLCLINLIIISPPASIFVFATFAILVLFLPELRTINTRRFSILFFVSTGLILIISLCLNYFETGLAEITPNKLFFDHMNYDIFSKKYSPYMITFLEMGSSSEFSQISITFDRVISNFELAFHFDQVSLIFGNTLTIIIIIAGVSSFIIKCQFKQLLILSTPVLVCIISVFCVGQPASVSRATEYVSLISILFISLGLIDWFKYLKGASDALKFPGYAIFIFLIGCSLYNSGVFLNAKLFVNLTLGSINYDEFYRTIIEKPPTMGRYSDIALRAKQKYGEDVHLLDLSLVSNRLGRANLIGTGITSEISYSFGRDWPIISHESAITSFPLLRKYVDVILINWDCIGISSIAFSDFLDPDKISDYFDVGLRNDDWIALVPKNVPGLSDESNRLTNNDITRWRQLRNRAPYKGLVSTMERIYVENGGGYLNRKLVVPDGLPKPSGWQ